MSRDIRVQFEVRDMMIMKNTLKMMGYDYNEMSPNKISLSGSNTFGLQNIVIDGDKSVITAGHGDLSKINKIKQSYMVEFYRDRAIQEGMQVNEEVNAQGEVILSFSH